jgi:hypothetical protein
MTLEVLPFCGPDMMATIAEGEDLCTLSGDPSWVSRQLALHVRAWVLSQTIH